MKKKVKPGASSNPLLTRSQSAMMSKKGSKSTEARTVPKRIIKKPVGFMDLPGELRNKVYGYYFQQEFVCELVDKEAKLSRSGLTPMKLSKKDLTTPVYFHSSLKCPESTVVRFPQMLGGYDRIEGLVTKWKTSLTALILVNKKVHAETIAFFYNKTLFCFNSPNRVLNFLKVVPAPNQHHVTKIQLHYRTYGDPKKTKDIPWKKKHLECWDKTFKIVATKLVNLKTIDIVVHLRETNVCLALSEPSLNPLFQFRRCSDSTRNQAKALETVNVVVYTMWTGDRFYFDPRLTLASKTLHTLFGLAVSRYILGESEEKAMAQLKEVWDDDFKDLHHHLRIMPPGW